jgi:hypothetical protein
LAKQEENRIAFANLVDDSYLARNIVEERKEVRAVNFD